MAAKEEYIVEYIPVTTWVVHVSDREAGQPAIVIDTEEEDDLA